MTTTCYVKGVTPDFNVLTTVFNNLDILYKHKDLILQNPEYYGVEIKGCAVSSLWIGSTKLWLGDMLQLWETPEWKIGNTYYFSIIGSPLSGSNECQTWSKEKGFSTAEYKSFGALARPAWLVRKMGTIKDGMFFSFSGQNVVYHDSSIDVYALLEILKTLN